MNADMGAHDNELASRRRGFDESADPPLDERSALDKYKVSLQASAALSDINRSVVLLVLRAKREVVLVVHRTSLSHEKWP